MPIDWRREVRPETVADLVARKNYTRAIELVQSRLDTDPSEAVRLQLANLLVQAGRGSEAVPLFMALADELAAIGFLARAVAALKRVEKIEPGRNDVEARLQALARERAATSKPSLGSNPALTAPLPQKPVPTPEPPAAVSAPTQKAPSPEPEVPPEAAPSEGRIKGRLLGAWRRLFGSESERPASKSTEEPSPASEEPLAEAPPPVDMTNAVPGPEPALADEEAKPKVLLPDEPPDEPLGPRPRREPTPGEEFLSMPEDALLDRVDDLIEDLFLPVLGPVVAQAPPVVELAGGLTGLMFDELAPDERLSVLRGLTLRTFEPGDVLVTEGEPSSGLYLLTAGGVKVFARDAESRNHPVASLEEGDFFGEIASRSGLPRNATVVASATGEMLELDQGTLDRLAVSHPKVWERMHAFARERAMDRQAESAEEEAGDTATGATPFEPKLRLRVASAFLRAGQSEEAVQILLELADELVQRGEGDKAVALLKKVERVRSGEAPWARGALPARPEEQARRRPVVTDDKLGQWLHGISGPAAAGPSPPKKARVWADRLAEPETLRAYAGLRDCRMFDELDEEGLLTLLQRLPLESCEAGDIVLTEGEPSDSLLVVATGRVKVFVRQRSGRDVLVRELGEGDFLGEIGVLTGAPRTATTTAATPSVLLRIDREPLEALCRNHPHARKVLEEVLAARSNNPEERSLRDDPGPD